MDIITKRWIRNAADELAVEKGYYFDEQAALHVVEFFRQFLCHSKGDWAGKPFELLDWQRDDVVMPLFGWKRQDGKRRFRNTYIEIPKKNGKSTLASGIGLYMLVGDGEMGAEVYSAATDQQQASIVHGEAINMIEASPILEQYLNINKSNKNITFEETKSYYRALTAEAKSKEGLNAHATICDEVHVWSGRGLWDTLKYAGRARSQPLLFVITTAGEDLQSICYKQHEYGRLVLAGTVDDPRFFCYIAAADKSDDWTTRETWYKANPSLGITINEEDFAADVEQAKKSPSDQASFKRYSLNIWSTSTNPWLNLDDWTKCSDIYTEKSLEGRVCFGGLDLSKTRDMTAFVLNFPEADEIYRQLAWFWLPHGTVYNIDREEELRVWADQGFLRVTDGVTCDYDQVTRDIAEICNRYNVREINYDVHYADQVTQTLDEQYGIPRVPFGQNVTNFASPCAEYERLVIAGKMRHNNHPIMTWQASHVQVKTDANNNMRPVKPPKGDHRKIDGIVAAIMALAGAMEDAAYGASVYESRGVLTI